MRRFIVKLYKWITQSINHYLPILFIIFIILFHIWFKDKNLNTEASVKYITAVTQAVGYLLIVAGIRQGEGGLWKLLFTWHESRPRFLSKEVEYNTALSIQGSQVSSSSVKLKTTDSIEKLREDFEKMQNDLVLHKKETNDKFDTIHKELDKSENRIMYEIESDRRHDEIAFYKKIKLDLIGLVFAVYGTIIGIWGIF